jgi:hypothetical protein
VWTIFSSVASAPGQDARAQFARGDHAVPRLPTATEAAALAARIRRLEIGAEREQHRSTATTVSPAPDTSRTFTG